MKNANSNVNRELVIFLKCPHTESDHIMFHTVRTDKNISCKFYVWVNDVGYMFG